ncbi:MAG: hypothetical protein LBV76_03860, partial [Deltaproteobacteria bacterium]|nr:hypothetical protein [Deltaproteobacteria bacterium]
MKGSLFKIAISGILIFFLLPVNTLKAAPVVAEQVRQELSLKDYAFFMVDQTSSIGIEQAGSSLQLHKYTKLSDGIPLTATGTLWVRFSLVNGSSAVSGGSIKADSNILLHLQSGTPPANMFVPQEISRNGEVFRWLKVLPNAEGDFVLPDPRNLPMTVYLKFSGTPGLWFNPVLHDLKFQPSAIRGYLQLALQAILVFSMFLALARGISGKEEWRLWGCGLIGCVIIQAIFCSQSPVFGRMTIVDLPQFLTPGITLILVAHIGR